MDLNVFIHPAPTLSRQIGHIICTSIAVSTICFVFSMVSFEFLSPWITLSECVLSLSHNITLFVLSEHEQKKTPEAPVGKFPATSTKAAIICTWGLALFWAGAAATVMVAHWFVALETSPQTILRSRLYYCGDRRFGPPCLEVYKRETSDTRI
ncbi:hypothetical protein BDZ97DRAFT_534496 [Flammula alnicola]|nr:hypothetical protein BDZ97DRAFT_534496 [Flammula alnicola]